MDAGETAGHERKSDIAFVQACWHKDLVDQIKKGFANEIAELGTPAENVDYFEVTGAFEIPLHARRLAEAGSYGAIVAAGLVVDGGIYRHEFVAEAVIGGLMQVQLETGIPVISAVLTPHHFHEHETHRGFFLRPPGDEGHRGGAGLLAHDRGAWEATRPQWRPEAFALAAEDAAGDRHSRVRSRRTRRVVRL
jgi:6,7-dimethyl-8-ribityllumazine synthase